VYYYYSLILAGFNPKEADRIFDSRADEIATAYVSRMAYQFVKDE